MLKLILVLVLAGFVGGPAGAEGWIGTRIVCTLRNTIDGKQLPGFGDSVIYYEIREDGIYTRTSSKSARWERSDLKLIGNRIAYTGAVRSTDQDKPLDVHLDTEIDLGSMRAKTILRNLMPKPIIGTGSCKSY